MFVDDDIRASPGWLGALLAAAREHPQVDVFTGPIRACLEGRRAARLRARAPADHHARAGRARHRRPLCVGREHGDPPQRPRAGGAVRRLARARRRRAGVAGTPARAHAGRARPVRGRRVGRAPSRRRRRAPALARARRLRARARRPALRRPPRAGALARGGAAHARRLPRARRAPPLPGGADDGGAQRRAPARGAARTRSGRARLDRRPRRTSCPAPAAPSAASTPCAARRATRR